MSPSPNQRMKTGTQASDGIGISALTSGRTKCSTGRKRPIRMPSGRPTDHRERETGKHPRSECAAAWRSMVPSASMSTSVPAIFGSVGSKAAGKMPLRAIAS